MSPIFLLSTDGGLLAHWRRSLGMPDAPGLDSFAALASEGVAHGSVIWLDQAVPDLPAWSDPRWAPLLACAKLIYASSFPRREQALAALDAGSAAYCHAYADAGTLRQVQEVVSAGHVWVGRELMQQLLASVQAARSVVASTWGEGLTEREREVAQLAANGASNRAIADQCGITERTVKAHLAAVFAKLHLTDRLQLALRVHGIT
ncbi:response regulator transcription factor [Chitinimonas arctica]|uniref:Response regulator transcription factor n=1 Tax=Chitinimonas arctica TaxID=2594795 RepID=A0A516SF40_9NEIS|nr:response regulator transcription factor [Chitinimonas arctica]QDQ26774.1 response regulator transcription factor [Chitinimonas arctica]